MADPKTTPAETQEEASSTALKTENASSGGSSGSSGGGGGGTTDSNAEETKQEQGRKLAVEQSTGPSRLFGFLSMVVSAFVGYLSNLHETSARATAQARGPLAKDVNGPIAGTVSMTGGIGTYLYTMAGMLITGQEPKLVAADEAQRDPAQRTEMDLSRPRERVLVDTNLRTAPNTKDLNEYYSRPVGTEEPKGPGQGQGFEEVMAGLARERESGPNLANLDAGSLKPRATPRNADFEKAKAEQPSTPSRSMPS